VFDYQTITLLGCQMIDTTCASVIKQHNLVLIKQW